MSLYDEVSVGGRTGQVKCWANRMAVCGVGDVVYPLPDITYDIAMREGGYVHVYALRIVGWDDQRNEAVPLYDKWGDPWVDERTNVGEVGRELRDLGLADPRYFFNKGEG